MNWIRRGGKLSELSWVAIIVIIGFIALYPMILLYSMHNTISQHDTNKETMQDIEILLQSLEREHNSLRKVIDKIQKVSQSNIKFSVSDLNLKPLTQIQKLETISQSIEIHENNSNKEPESSISTINSSIKIKGKPFPKPIIFETDGASPSTSSVLVVGGTDGSGTRRVVQILAELGATITSEDPETYDIHADMIGGWPPLVNQVLKQTHTLNYNINDLSTTNIGGIKQSVQRLLNQAQSDSKKPTSYKLAVGGALPKTVGSSTTGINYGFKAPVAMTLVPLWAEMTSNFRFLHVLRDGRDIAFSVNQGPVEKFYTTMYGNKQEVNQIKAIRLWSDWNSELYHWSQNIIKSNKNSDKSYQYMVIHSEDVVDEDLNVRFAAMYQLAKWIGSSLNNDEICCIANKNMKFMGSHDRTL